MDADTRRKLAMAGRALAFITAHPTTDASYTAIVTQLQDDVTHGDALAIQQRDGQANQHDAKDRRDDLRRTLQQGKLRHLVLVARRAAASNAAVAGEFFLPKPGGPNLNFLTAAKSMLAAATAQQSLFTSFGAGDDFFPELTQSITDFETMTTTIQTNQANHIGARAELAAIAEDCVRLVNLLDNLNRERFAGNAELLTAWNSARSVNGRVRRRPAKSVLPPAPVAAPPVAAAAPPAVGSTPAPVVTPVTVAEVAPAAAPTSAPVKEDTNAA